MFRQGARPCSLTIFDGECKNKSERSITESLTIANRPSTENSQPDDGDCHPHYAKAFNYCKIRT